MLEVLSAGEAPFALPANEWVERPIGDLLNTGTLEELLPGLELVFGGSGDRIRPRERPSLRGMVLEVTESAAATDVGKALENLARLRMKGFGLSIDDYGTGYSSMQQLTRIAFTELKIDQSFVTKATRHESARVILESSLSMAKKLRITAVAEGVETQQDWDLLRRLDCDLAQGYFIARPMAAEIYLGWIEDWTLAGSTGEVTKGEPGHLLPAQQSIGQG
ncbi:MAG TPA: EAL domain-containing protein [Thermoanaerobaculia bacterium]|nr:EAL domain-containing protein [Thermoanaerobaculia bacterium]